MGDDFRVEVARLKEQLHRVRQVCELHRRLGEDTSFEIRELRRKIEVAKDRVAQFRDIYREMTTKAFSGCDEQTKSLLELCDVSLNCMETAIGLL